MTSPCIHLTGCCNNATCRIGHVPLCEECADYTLAVPQKPEGHDAKLAACRDCEWWTVTKPDNRYSCTEQGIVTTAERFPWARCRMNRW